MDVAHFWIGDGLWYVAVYTFLSSLWSYSYDAVRKSCYFTQCLGHDFLCRILPKWLYVNFFSKVMFAYHCVYYVECFCTIVNKFWITFVHMALSDSCGSSFEWRPIRTLPQTLVHSYPLATDACSTRLDRGRTLLCGCVHILTFCVTQSFIAGMI